MLGVAALVAVGCDAPRPRSLLLISIDTLRADHLGCYGHERPTSPHLDALAAEGVLFEDVTAPSPWTLPSHASLFTGRYPSRHGVRTVRDRLSPSVPTLAEMLSPGLETAAIVNVVYLDRGFALMRGFAHLERVESKPSPAGAAREVNDRALAWLGERQGRRVFLFLHHFDVHSDYRSEPRHEQIFAVREGPVRGLTAELAAINQGRLPASPEVLEQLERRYDAGIRQLDEELGRLFDRLEAEGWLEDSLVAVTSDHGEAFFEHGYVGHGLTQYQEMLRVPLILRGPGVPRGVRVREPVSLVDVAPTLLLLLGVPPPSDLDGRDLWPHWQGPPARTERGIFAEAAPALQGTTRSAARLDSHKLLLDEASGRRELYDLAKDPREQHDLSAQDPERVRRLEAALDEVRRSPVAGPRLDLPPELLDRLRALGYE